MTSSPPGAEVVVREATLADVDALVDTGRRRRRMAEDVEGDDAVVLVAEAGGELVGQLGLHLGLEVWPHDSAAIALYERFGFQREGYLTRHYRRRSGDLWDAIIMGMRLD